MHEKLQILLITIAHIFNSSTDCNIMVRTVLLLVQVMSPGFTKGSRKKIVQLKESMTSVPTHSTQYDSTE